MARNRSMVFWLFMLIMGVTGAQNLQWVGNTRLWLTGVGAMPTKGAYVETWQTVSVTTQTYPIAPGQRVFAVVTTDNWQSTQEYEFSFDYNTGNNTQWYIVLGFPAGSDVQFYIRATGPNGEVQYDNNGWQNFGFYARYAPPSRTSPILQWFETDYRTILQRLPEVVMAGYGAIYLPAPQKSGGGGFSTGYNPFDRFDLGDRFQKGTVRTQYGSTQELMELIQVAKRFGIEVYCDLVVNHNDNRASTSIANYPDMIPEDFHIRSSSDTTNGEMDLGNVPPFGWNTLNLDVVGLADIAQEDGNNTRTGAFSLPPYATFNQWDKPSFVRHPLNPYYYPTGMPYAEDVRQYLKRWGWWLTSVIGFDGYRIDAVRHTPPAFFDWIVSGQPGSVSSQGDLLPYLYSVNPNVYIFGEDYTGDHYELREYAKTGMNLLDFPMKFMVDSLFNSSGFGSLGASLSNGYSIDSSTGLLFEAGGLAAHVGVGFIQSHDQGAPWSNNLAYAWLLTRSGRPLVYYDGNNINPSDSNHFPKPGRFDALGNGSDNLLKMLDVRKRFGQRGNGVNRHVTDHLYIYERQVNGNGILLVGLNNRGDQTALSATVQTAFPAGSVLVDLSGQQPPITVGSDRRVTITVPPNTDANSTNNARGYVFYALQAPQALQGTPPVQFFDAAGNPIGFQTYQTPAGHYAQPRSFEAAVITGDQIQITVRTDNTGVGAILQLDNGLPVAGRTPGQNTPEGLADGYVSMDWVANGHFVLNNVHLSNLENGLHVIRVRVFLDTQGRPGIYNEFTAFFYLNRPVRGRVMDGELAEYGNPLASQTRTPTSSLNRLDALYVHNDHEYLYVGLAGRVDPSENLTNGTALFLDVDYGQGTGIQNFALVEDDSGPAPRLLSNARVTAPNGFGAEYAVGSFRHSALHSSPEAFFTGQPRSPFTVGSQAGFYFLNPDRLNWLEGRAARIAWSPRLTSQDPARGLEVAIPLRTLYPNGLKQNQILGLIAYLATTGETGAVFSASDSRRGPYGGRPPATGWLFNQFLPVQPNIINNPGASAVTLQQAATYTFRRAQQPTTPYRLHLGRLIRDPQTGHFYQTGTVTNASSETLSGPIFLWVKLPPNAELVNRTGNSMIEAGAAYLTLSEEPMGPARTFFFRLEYRAPNARLLGDLKMELRVGEGVL